jgi:hypothetical protein
MAPPSLAELLLKVLFFTNTIAPKWKTLSIGPRPSLQMPPPPLVAELAAMVLLFTINEAVPPMPPL